MHVWCCCRAEGQNPVPQQLLRKYIAYAQQFVQPVLSGEAKLVLRSFYLELRGMRAAAQDVPVTVRRSGEESPVRCLVAFVRYSAESMPVIVRCLYQPSLNGEWRLQLAAICRVRQRSICTLMVP